MECAICMFFFLTMARKMKTPTLTPLIYGKNAGKGLEAKPVLLRWEYRCIEARRYEGTDLQLAGK